MPSLLENNLKKVREVTTAPEEAQSCSPPLQFSEEESTEFRNPINGSSANVIFFDSNLMRR